jgi:hypothetical protein
MRGYPTHDQKMKNKAPAKLKRRERALLRARARVRSSGGANKWSKSVSSWVAEFQNRDGDPSLPAFDSLFKETQTQTRRLEIGPTQVSQEGNEQPWR